MPNVLIISAESASANEPCDARLAYINYADTANSVTATHDSANTGKLYDGLTTLAWRPGVSGVSSVTFNSVFEDTGSGAKFSAITYLGVTGVNWQTAGASITIKDENGTTIASASGLRDNQPLFVVIDEAVYSALQFEFTATNTTLEVGEIHFGPTMDFPRNVKVGYGPARWDNNDIVTNSNTEANQFASSTIRKRGSTEDFIIDFVPIDFMDNDYRTFINNAQGKQVFFVWNKLYQSHGVYGNWTARKPTFISTFYSSINMTIKGVA